MKQPMTFDEYLEEQMKDPEFKAEWDTLEAEFQKYSLEDMRRMTPEKKRVIFLQGLDSFTDDFNIEDRFPFPDTDDK